MGITERKRLNDYVVYVKVVSYQRVEVSTRSEWEAEDKAVEVISGRDHLDFEFDYVIDGVMLRD